MLIVNVGNKETELHFGEMVPVLDHKWSRDVELFADCDELNYILRTFHNIPSYPARSMTWYGDMAKFIYQGLLVKQWR